MAKQNFLAVLRAALVLGFTTYSYGQTSVQQKADKSQCTNIVALAGSVNVNCSSLTAAQAKAISNIPAILKMSLENQNYFEQILQKLAEMTPSAQQPVTCQSGASCGISTGQTGGITAGTFVNPEQTQWYEFDGASHRRQGNRQMAGAGLEMIDFRKMIELNNSGDWIALKKLAEDDVSKYPGWPTPFQQLYISNAKLCEKEAALNNAKTFIDKATIASQFSGTYADGLRVAQTDLAGMKAGNWSPPCP